MKEKNGFKKEDYLKTPESFNLMVENCVKEQLEKEKGVISMKQYKSKRKKAGTGFVKVAVAVLAICVVAGGGVWAARQYQLSKMVEKDFGPNEIHVEENIQIVEEKQTLSDELPGNLEEVRPDLEESLREDALITIKEAYFDGSKLYIYAEATDYGEQFSDNMGADHIYINGELRVGGMYSVGKGGDSMFAECENTIFYSELQLADMMLTEDFTVEVLFSAFAEEEVIRTNVVFEVAVDNASRIYKNIRTELKNGYVDVHECSISSTTTYIKFAYYLSGENAKEQIESLCESFIRMRDDQGNESDAMFNGYNPNDSTIPKAMQTEDGFWYVVHDFYMNGISEDASSITITPYYVGFMLEEDERMYEPGEVMEFGIFTIELK